MNRIAKGISVRQPWAHSIIHEGKAIENRSWSTGLRGTIAIHAGRAIDDDAFFKFIHERHLDSKVKLNREQAKALERGAIIGVVDIVDCVTHSESPWFEGPFGFVLANPRPIKPIPCLGALQFFDLPLPVVDLLNDLLVHTS
jgi:ASCH domain